RKMRGAAADQPVGFLKCEPTDAPSRLFRPLECGLVAELPLGCVHHDCADRSEDLAVDGRWRKPRKYTARASIDFGLSDLRKRSRLEMVDDRFDVAGLATVLHVRDGSF